jgi:hypothetical protein
MQPWYRSRWFRGAGSVLAVTLLVLAVILATREVDWSVLAAASPAAVVALAALVVVNLVVTAGVFWLITLSFDARPVVGPLKMAELITGSALLNYVPVVRPGLWGRAAYLKAYHALPITQSLLILAVVMALAVASAVATLTLLLPVGSPGRWGALIVALLALAAVSPMVGRVILRRRVRLAWLWLPVRMLDLLAAAARLWLAFAILGQPIAFDTAVLIGAAGLLVKLAGVTPNGLGLSEWVVAGLAAVLSPASTAIGAAAAVLDRAVEVAVVVPAGLLAVWRLRGRVRGKA